MANNGGNKSRSNYQKSSGQRSSSQSRSRSSRSRRIEAQKRKRQKLIIRILVIIIAVALVATMILSVASCNRNKQPQPTAINSGNTEAAGAGLGNDEENESEETTTEAVSSKVSLTAVGDIIAHDTILELAQTGNGYDFTSLFSPLKNDIARMDLAIANVETPLGGGPYTGYPSFNTPDEMGLAVINTGFDVALQASNHSMDSGTDGIRHCIDFWKQHATETMMVGLHESQEEADTIPIITKNGISFAVLNYTYGLNGYELPYDESYLITVMDDSTRDYIRNQVAQASELADFVIVCPHWGEENQVGEPLDFQRDWANLFTEAGADLILGTHPHVIENVEWVNADNGNRALCYYSLGNFVSNQQYTDLVLGAMAYVEIEKDESGVHIVDGSAKAVPFVTHNDKTGDPVVIQTYYLADYTDELAAVHDTYLTYDGEFSVPLLKQKAQDTLGDWIIDRLP